MAIFRGISIINFFLAIVVTILVVSTIVYSQTSGNANFISVHNATLDNTTTNTNLSIIPVTIIQPVAVVPVVLTNGEVSTSTETSRSKFSPALPEHQYRGSLGQ